MRGVEIGLVSFGSIASIDLSFSDVTRPFPFELVDRYITPKWSHAGLAIRQTVPLENIAQRSSASERN